jgi:hypothetical protein
MGLISNGTTLLDAGALDSGVPTGSMTLIKTLTASNNGTLSFVHGSSSVVLDGTYKEYIFKILNVHPSADNRDLDFNLSTDSGSNYDAVKTTTYFYTYHQEGGGGGSLEYVTSSDLAQSDGVQELMENVGGDADQSGCGELHLFDPANTSFVKHFIAKTTNASANNYNKAAYVAGYANTTSAINGVRFNFNSDNIQTGVIKLYGVK